VDVRGADRIVVPPFGSTAALSTASSGRALLPQSSNDLTLFFELRLIDFAAGEPLRQDIQCGRRYLAFRCSSTPAAPGLGCAHH
jgi:hypothetical protein